MEQQSRAYLSKTLSMTIRSCSLSRDDLRKLIDKLQEYSKSASEIELSHFKDNIDNQNPPDNFDTMLKNLKEAFDLRLTVTGTEGQELFGTIPEVFENNNFPDQVLGVFIDSTLAHKANYNYFPRNHFQLFLDFSKSRLIDFSITPSQPTPNNSNFKASGLDSTWTNGIFNEVRNLLIKRSSSFFWIHKQYIYDIILWLVGYPMGFWACYKLSRYIKSVFGEISIFLQSAAYVYIFLLALSLVHFLFRYSRWIWPVVEYKTQYDKASKHRKTLGVVVLGLVGAMTWDLIKLLFSN